MTQEGLLLGLLVLTGLRIVVGLVTLAIEEFPHTGEWNRGDYCFWIAARLVLIAMIVYVVWVK